MRRLSEALIWVLEGNAPNDIDETIFALIRDHRKKPVDESWWYTEVAHCLAYPIHAALVDEYESGDAQEGFVTRAFDRIDEPDNELRKEKISEYLKERGFDEQRIKEQIGGVGSCEKALVIPRTTTLLYFIHVTGECQCPLAEMYEKAFWYTVYHANKPQSQEVIKRMRICM